VTQAENLPQSLAEQFPSNLIPLRTTGDGNCLLHAISRALFGVEVPLSARSPFSTPFPLFHFFEYKLKNK